MRKKTLQDLINSMRPKIRNAFLASINDITSEAQLTVLQKALEENRIDDFIRILGISPEFFEPLDAAIREAFVKGGTFALASLPVLPDPVQPGKSLSALELAIPERKTGYLLMALIKLSMLQKRKEGRSEKS